MEDVKFVEQMFKLADTPIYTPHNSFLFTYTGKKFYPLEPNIDDINIVDIAHSLSMQTRYNGHGKIYYSVAEHSVLIAQKLFDSHRSIDTCMWGLLHDSPEAYTQDLIHPIKKYFPLMTCVQDNLMDKIGAKFHLSIMEPDIVKTLDEDIRYFEKITLFDNRWVSNTLMRVPENEFEIRGLDPMQARQKFIDIYNKLAAMYNMNISEPSYKLPVVVLLK